MDINQLRNFVEAANCNSISRASQNLYISQAACSLSITSLERELNVTLFYRSKKGVTLTEYGNQVYEHSLQILQFVDTWKSFGGSSPKIAGEVHIAIPFSAMSTFLGETISRIHQEYKDIKIFCDTNDTSEYDIHIIFKSPVNIIMIDFNNSLLEHYSQIAQQYNHEIIKLYDDEGVILINSNNPLARKEQIFFEDLKDLNAALINSREAWKKNSHLSNDSQKIFTLKKKYFNDKTQIIDAMLEDETLFFWTALKSIENVNFVRKGLLTYRHVIDVPHPCSMCMFRPKDKKSMTIAEQIVAEYIEKSFA